MTVMSDEQAQQAITDHKPLTVGLLTFVDAAGGDIRVDLPQDKDHDAVLLTPADTERLVCWLSGKCPVVREYIDRLKHGRMEVHVDPSVSEFLVGPTLGERISIAVRTIRQSKPTKHSGDAAWLAKMICVRQMTALRYMKDQAIPEPPYAQRIASVLGWSEQHMAHLLLAARLRAVAKKSGENSGPRI